MAETSEGAKPIDERLGSVEHQVIELRSDVDGLRGDVQKLRVLEEANAETIKLIAEGHGAKLDSHSAKLDEITEALKPLGEIHDFLKRVAHDHEVRISALELPAGGKQPEG